MYADDIDPLGDAERLEERLDIAEGTLRRAYAREHPLAISLSLAALTTGALIVIFPWFGEGSSALRVIPYWAQLLWGFSFGIGGGLSLYGFWHYDRRAEGAGSMMQATAYLTTFLTVLSARGLQGIAPGLFLLFLAAGFYLRALFVRSGS